MQLCCDYLNLLSAVLCFNFSVLCNLVALIKMFVAQRLWQKHFNSLIKLHKAEKLKLQIIKMNSNTSGIGSWVRAGYAGTA